MTNHTYNQPSIHKRDGATVLKYWGNLDYPTNEGARGARDTAYHSQRASGRTVTRHTNRWKIAADSSGYGGARGKVYCLRVEDEPNFDATLDRNSKCKNETCESPPEMGLEASGYCFTCAEELAHLLAAEGFDGSAAYRIARRTRSEGT